MVITSSMSVGEHHMGRNDGSGHEALRQVIRGRRVAVQFVARFCTY